MNLDEKLLRFLITNRATLHEWDGRRWVIVFDASSRPAWWRRALARLKG